MGKSLREEFEGVQSLRVNRLRIVYRIVVEERTVDVVAIGPRASIYQENLRLVSRDSQD